MSKILFKAIGIWLVIVVFAILNGVFREKVLVAVLGVSMALPVSGLLLAVLIFLITLMMVSFIGSANPMVYISIGLLWIVLTLSFEFSLGYLVAGKSWQEILQVFNIRNGDLFIVDLFATAVSPWIAARRRGLL